MALAHGLQACWSTPITSSAGKALGAFAIYHKSPTTPTSFLEGLVQQFTHIASIAVARVQNDAALKRSEAFLVEGQRLSATGSYHWRVATDELTWSDQLYRIFDSIWRVPVTLELIATRFHPEDIRVMEDIVTGRVMTVATSSPTSGCKCPTGLSSTCTWSLTRSIP